MQEQTTLDEAISAAGVPDEAHVADAQPSPGDPHGQAAVTTALGEEEHGHGGGADVSWLGLDATGWVSVAMIILLAIIVWKKVPQAIGRLLDARIARARADLDEARRLRSEAEALLADYSRKQAEASRDAEAILAGARNEAEMLVADAGRQAEALIARRTRMAEDRIAAAERAAADELRARAATLATEAARRLIIEQSDAATQTKLADRAIAELDGRLN
jgi:F-type H+-transporting ATPase subunit b